MRWSVTVEQNGGSRLESPAPGAARSGRRMNRQGSGPGLSNGGNSHGRRSISRHGITGVPALHQTRVGGRNRHALRGGPCPVRRQLAAPLGLRRSVAHVRRARAGRLVARNVPAPLGQRWTDGGVLLSGGDGDQARDSVRRARVRAQGCPPRGGGGGGRGGARRIVPDLQSGGRPYWRFSGPGLRCG